jgi:Tol biopolymer transport system component
LIGGGILLLVVAVPAGLRIYSSVEMGDQQQNVAGDQHQKAVHPHGKRVADGGGVSQQQGTPNEDPTDDIAFVANGELAVIDADGSGLTILALGNTPYSNYDWSPDGQKIVFYGDYRLHVIDADGTGESDLTRFPYGGEFDWSPDGEKIALAAGAIAAGGLSVINPDGTGKRKLTHTGASVSERSPSFSPNGEKIAFVTNNDVYVISADGSGLKNLTDTTAYEEDSTAWSPSGEKIAFVRQRTVTKGQHTVQLLYDLYVMNTDGTSKTLVAENVSYGPPDPIYGSVTFPAFSPDGQKIAFARPAVIQRDLDDEDIYVTNTDGTGERKLTDTPSADESRPAWSPDGEKIAFRRCCENASEITNAGPRGGPVPIVGIHVMNADGTGERKLTDTPEYIPMKIQWRPVE